MLFTENPENHSRRIDQRAKRTGRGTGGRTTDHLFVYVPSFPKGFVDRHGLAEREKDGWGGILDRIHEKSSRPGDYACKGFVKLI